MIPGFEFSHFAQTAGPIAAVLVLMSIIFAESGLLIGFFLPGDTILFTAGFLVQTGILNFNIHALVVLVFIAAVLGDGVGYLFGRRMGPRIFSRQNSLLFKQENVQKAEEFYKKHGSKTIVIARFIPVIRTFAPIVAGVGKMPYRDFVTYNIVGALLWAVGITYAGYIIGAWFESIGLGIDTILLPVILIILLVSVLPPVIHILKDAKRREVMWNGTKKQWTIVKKWLKGRK